jgi:hypothetical protein
MRNLFKALFPRKCPPRRAVIDRIYLTDALQRAGLTRRQARIAKNVICDYLARLEK